MRVCGRAALTAAAHRGPRSTGAAGTVGGVAAVAGRLARHVCLHGQGAEDPRSRRRLRGKAGVEASKQHVDEEERRERQRQRPSVAATHRGKNRTAHAEGVTRRVVARQCDKTSRGEE